MAEEKRTSDVWKDGGNTDGKATIDLKAHLQVRIYLYFDKFICWENVVCTHLIFVCYLLSLEIKCKRTSC